MSKIAVLIGNTYIHWVSVIVVAAALTAIFIFLASYRKSGGNLNAAALFIPLALVLSVLFSRIVHWYCRFELYGGLISAITDFTGGGYALFGVFIGTMLSAIIVSVIKLEKNALLLFDCMAPAAAF